MYGGEETISSVTSSDGRTTLTIVIDGPYFPLTKFRQAIDSLLGLLTEIDKETSNKGDTTVEWSIQSIESGSIHMTAVATPVNEERDHQRPSEVMQTFTSGIARLQDAPVIPDGFSEAALRHTRAFGELINPDDFAAIQLGSDGWNTSIAPRLAGNVNEIARTTQKYYGSIEGVLVSISLSGRQTLGIRSKLEGKTIKCFFKDDLFEVAKEALGKRVYVFGIIRQRRHGPKINIEVHELRMLPSREEQPSVNDILARLRGEP